MTRTWFADVYVGTLSENIPSNIRRYTAYVKNLILAFNFHWRILQYPLILLEDSKSPDQTAQMRSLITAFVVRIGPKKVKETFLLGAGLIHHNLIITLLLGSIA